ncbi:MAG TPA: carbamoyl phosphate synthase large subunit, partial [Spirochaetota bacterium]|nr:carbamoyl phosphate synthase large subunit [Spirochaetota bacterium]HQA53729.1 carbamoyl phosphate synthase large subunit [Spirochaetota bacterium]
IFVSLNERSRSDLAPDLLMMYKEGFKFLATGGTAEFLRSNGMECSTVNKVSEGRPNILDLLKNNEIDMIFNTPRGKAPKSDSNLIRQVALRYKIPIITTGSAIKAAVEGIIRMKNCSITVRALQDYHAEVKQHLLKK